MAQLQRRKVEVRRGRQGCGDWWEVGVSGAATGCGAGRAETEAVPAQVREAQSQSGVIQDQAGLCLETHNLTRASAPGHRLPRIRT